MEKRLEFNNQNREGWGVVSYPNDTDERIFSVSVPLNTFSVYDTVHVVIADIEGMINSGCIGDESEVDDLEIGESKIDDEGNTIVRLM